MVDGDGREEPHTLAIRLAGAGSKQLTLGLSTGAAAGPQWADATRSKAACGGVWGVHRNQSRFIIVGLGQKLSSKQEIGLRRCFHLTNKPRWRQRRQMNVALLKLPNC